MDTDEPLGLSADGKRDYSPRVPEGVAIGVLINRVW